MRHLQRALYVADKEDAIFSWPVVISMDVTLWILDSAQSAESNGLVKGDRLCVDWRCDRANPSAALLFNRIEE